ncbi:hypothetical protein ANANG_G00070190 [Anguilla anguilla]|uniref:Uncharacterized protein n=1 Tax=Anguilla anguilla TaxID=7936 RepID=A0A9D3S7S9_ANGAN|nr:hypothetical protein ANANG_G00070190 [Anguilla anguilla]
MRLSEWKIQHDGQRPASQGSVAMETCCSRYVQAAVSWMYCSDFCIRDRGLGHPLRMDAFVSSCVRYGSDDQSTREGNKDTFNK